MDTTNLVQKRFRDLATRAQEAGARIASQVKEQQSKFGNRSIAAGSQNSKQMQRESETETALKLVQFQNKALRDRLRSTAAENERLHEMLKQYRDLGLDNACVGISSGPQRSEPHKADVEAGTVIQERSLPDDDHDLLARIPSEVDGTIRAVKASSDAEEKVASNLSQLGKEHVHDASKENRLEETIGLLREELRAQTLKHQNEIEDARREGREELSKLKSQLQETLKENSAMKQTESIVEVEHGELQRKLESLESNLIAVQNEKDEAICKAATLQSLVEEVSQLRRNHAEEIYQLQETLASQESMNSILLQEIEELKSKSIIEMDSLIDEASWLKHGAEELQTQLKESQEEKRLLEERISSILTEISTLKDFKEQSEGKLRQQSQEVPLQSAPCQKCIDYDAVVSQRDKAHIQIMLLTKDKNHLHIFAEEMKAELRSRQADYEADIVERVRESERLQSQVEHSEQEILKLGADLKDRMLQCETLEKENQDLRAHSRDKNWPYDDVVSQLQEAKSRNEQLEAMLNQEKSEFDIYRIKMELKIRNIEETLAKEQQEIENIKAMADGLDSDDSLSADDGLHPGDQHFISNNSSDEHDPKYATISTPSIMISEKAPEYEDILGFSDQALQSLQTEIKALQAALIESEHTHELRDAACQVLKEEIAELKRTEKRSSVDVDYLKAVLVKSFSCGELDSSSPIFDVISRLLQFSPDDVQRAKEKRQRTSDLMETANAIIGKWTDIVSGV